jgi:hypothetical protein
VVVACCRSWFRRCTCGCAIWRSKRLFARTNTPSVLPSDG